VKETLYRTVQLISPGWNQIALPQGYPTRLFVNQDFSGSGVERLYGIFIDGNGKASLYSSATGVDDWRPEAHGEVPQHMATSPGVAYDNKLWLIGGSCVDANNPGSEVWCYEEDPNTKVRRWNKKSDFPRDMTARMGHACVVFRQEIWVLGGYNQQNASSYQDVWCLEKVSVSPEKYNWELVSQKCAWSPRLNPAVVTFQKTQTDSELWIYGGSAKPQSGGLYDLWSTTDGTTWKQKSDTISPDPGTPLGATLVTYSLPDSPGSRISDRLLLIGSFLEWAPGRQPQDGQQGKSGNRVSSFLFEWQSLKLLWEANPAFKGWQQFRGDNFYMQAVAFNGFLFVWSLQPKIESTLKLNILVP
jgi:hypothetical protein